MGNRFKIPFEVGTWAGLAAFAYFLILWLVGVSPFGILRFGDFWLPFIFIFIAVRKQLKTTGGEGFTFSNAFFSGMITAIVLGCVKGILVFMVVEFIDLSLMDKTYDESITVLQYAKKIAPLTTDTTTINQQISTLTNDRQYPESWELAFGEVNMNFYGGFVVSLLAALIYNRKPKHAAKA